MAALKKFSDFIEVPLKCFGVLGLNPYDKEVETRRKKVLRVYFYVSTSSAVTCIAFLVVYVEENFKNFSKIAEAVPGGIFTLLGLTKFFSILAKKDTFGKVIETLDELFPKTKEEQRIFDVEKYWKSFKRVERIFVGLVVTTGVALVTMSIFKLVLFGSWYDNLPFENWYPFGTSNPVCFNLVFLWQIVDLVVTVGSLLGSELIFYSFITLVSMQFDILCLQLEKLSSKHEAKRFAELAEFHEKLLKLSKDLEEIFSPSILLNFVGSSILICLVVYQLSIDISFEQFVKFFLMLAVALLQILLLCYNGNKLTNAAGQVETSVYNCDWFESHNREFKSVLIMTMQRSQRPTVLTTFKFSILNLEAFTTVLGTSYSYFTLLRSLSGH